MSIPTIEELSDERIDGLQSTLTQMLQLGEDGFANNMIWKREVASLLIEVKRYRQRTT